MIGFFGSPGWYIDKKKPQASEKFIPTLLTYRCFQLKQTETIDHKTKTFAFSMRPLRRQPSFTRLRIEIHLEFSKEKSTSPTNEMQKSGGGGEKSSQGFQGSFLRGRPNQIKATSEQSKQSSEDKAMEDNELDPLEKAIQIAHSNFFVEEDVALRSTV